MGDRVIPEQTIEVDRLTVSQGELVDDLVSWVRETKGGEQWQVIWSDWGYK